MTRRAATLGLFVALAVGGPAAADLAQPSRTANDLQSFEVIERGRYLATLGDCTACHTAADGKAYAGGRPIDTPFGVLVSPNLTPDRETGIGAWSDDDFVNAVRVGRGPGGMHLYQAMPYPYFVKMSREDVLAIRTYLNTLEPVRNPVDTNQLPFPFRIRASMIAWNALFFRNEPFKPDPQKSEEWNRGAYLVEGPGHCGACHTPKNFLGGDKTSSRLAGGALQNWYSPDLTGDQWMGLGKWSTDDIVQYLRSGHNRIAAATGPMAEVIADSTSLMTDPDLHAIALYLKGESPKGGSASQPIAGDDPVMRTGKELYVDNCSAYHAPNGTGVPNLFPELKDSPTVQSKDPLTLIRIVLHGTQNVATPTAPTGPAMPAFSWKLNDEQVAAVLTYIRNAWGNAAPRVSASDVGKVQRATAQETR